MSNITAVLPTDPSGYWAVYDKISSVQIDLNTAEKLWAAWYQYMQNDVLATGITSFVMHETVYFGRCLPWMIIDYIPYFQKYKIQQGHRNTLKEQLTCAALVLLQHFTVELPQIWMFHPLTQYFGISISTPFPSWQTIAYQVAIFFVCEDAWHYWFHRAFHWGPLYRGVHKLHHKYSAPFGLAAEFASPIEVMALGFGSVGIPIVWCALTGNLHVITMYIWIILRLFQAIDAHSGYEFPWSLHHFLPFWAGAEHHDVHHEKFVGNYASSFRWWDYMLGTETDQVIAKMQAKKAASKKAL
ncbi:putative C-4 methylsterol oxidase [Ascobolus immersus RN42]|uniref:Putative C-4 methylsterol oxidase n=1 Tax=Ascobolus immersus RN42 TaxID=1160509 RepID=A0A3N4IHE9_ASCIM|nr:putative C-4 methylsterol oxidase [Ascobolus immersus RN42]